MNIFKQASGKLTSLARTRTFLKGEIFIQTADQKGDSSGAINGLYFVDKVTHAPITQFFAGDIYGGCDCVLDGKDKDRAIEIYQLGSGNSLKFGQKLLFKWDEDATKEVKDHPNTLYLYVGNGNDWSVTKTAGGSLTYSLNNDAKKAADGSSLSKSASSLVKSSSDWSRTTAAKDSNDTTWENDQIGDSGVYSDENSLLDILNSGDLVFYSPVYNEFFFWHMSRAQDSLTRITTGKLLSASMYNAVAAINSTKGALLTAPNSNVGSGSTQDSTSLLDLINGPFRYNQSLDDKYGWPELAFRNYTGEADSKAVQLTDNGTWEEDKSAGATAQSFRLLDYPKYDADGVAANLAGKSKDKDGYIAYVPFKDEEHGKRWQYNDDFYVANDDNTFTRVHPGDLVVSIPCTAANVKVGNKQGDEIPDDSTNLRSGLTHVAIPLFAATLESLDIKGLTIKRADDYATARWKNDIVSPGNDGLDFQAGDDSLLAYLNDREHKDTRFDNGSTQYLRLVLENLYKTKVDIDPVTKKIVTSQLPETILGALKYLGTLNASETAYIGEEIDAGYTADDKKVNLKTLDEMLKGADTEAELKEVAKKFVWGYIKKDDYNKVKEVKEGCFVGYDDSGNRQYKVTVDGVEKTLTEGDASFDNFDWFDYADEGKSDANKSDADRNDDFSQWDTSLAKGNYFIWNGDPFEFRAPAANKDFEDWTTEEKRSYIFSDAALAIENEVDQDSVKGSKVAVLNDGYVIYGDELYKLTPKVAVEEVTEDGDTVYKVAYKGGESLDDAIYTKVRTSGITADNQITVIDADIKSVNVWTPVDTENTEAYKAAYKNGIVPKDIEDASTDHKVATSTGGSAVTTHAINNGDFLIFNGEKFDVIDNSDSLVALTYTDEDGYTHLLDGTPVLESSSRNAKHTEYVKNADNSVTTTDVDEDVDVDSIRLIASSSNKGIQFVSPNTIIFKDTIDNKGGEAFTEDKYINFITEGGVAYKSRFYFESFKPSEDSTEEQKRFGSVSVDSILKLTDKVSLNFNEDVTSKRYVFGDSLVGRLKSDDTSVVNAAFVFPFLPTSTTKDSSGKTVVEYWSKGFGIGSEKDPALRVPDYSGTLTTEEYVNDGFQIIEEIIKSLYNYLNRGSEDFLQTIRYNKATGAKEIVDSHISQVYNRDYQIDKSGKERFTYTGINFFVDDEKTGDGLDHNVHSDASGLSQLMAVSKLGYFEDEKYNANTANAFFLSSTLGDTTTMPEWHRRLTVDEKTGKVQLPDDVLSCSEEAGHPLNVLPNHSGVILNSDSIIDCGFWDEGNSESDWAEVQGSGQLEVKTMKTEAPGVQDEYTVVQKTAHTSADRAGANISNHTTTTTTTTTGEVANTGGE